MLQIHSKAAWRRLIKQIKRHCANTNKNNANKIRTNHVEAKTRDDTSPSLMKAWHFVESLGWKLHPVIPNPCLMAWLRA